MNKNTSKLLVYIKHMQKWVLQVAIVYSHVYAKLCVWKKFWTFKKWDINYSYFIFYLLILQRGREGGREERERERETSIFVFLLMYTFIGWFFYVCWTGIEPTTLAYWDNALTNWALQPGPWKVILNAINEIKWWHQPTFINWYLQGY